jgi:hypothetical protein
MPGLDGLLGSLLGGAGAAGASANPIGLGISAGLGAIKGITGLFQSIRGNQILKHTKRPGYDIPGEFQQNVGLAKDIKTAGGMPRAQYLNALQNISRNQNFGLTQLGDRRGVTAGIGLLAKRGNDAALNLDVQDAGMAMQNRILGTKLQMNALQTLAGQRLAKQNWEKFQPYQQKIQEAHALIGSGMQNAFNGLSDIGNSFMADNMYSGGAGMNGLAAMLKRRRSAPAVSGDAPAANPYSKGLQMEAQMSQLGDYPVNTPEVQQYNSEKY